LLIAKNSAFEVDLKCISYFYVDSNLKKDSLRSFLPPRGSVVGILIYRILFLVCGLIMLS
jgi:hypothetical protein